MPTTTKIKWGLLWTYILLSAASWYATDKTNDIRYIFAAQILFGFFGALPLIRNRPALLKLRLIFIILASSCALVYWALARNSSVTLGVFAFSTLTIVGISRTLPTALTKCTGLSRVCHFLFSVSCLFWILASSVDYYRASASSSKPNADRLLARRDLWPRARIAIALSGGGYRAAFMHAGVLNAYEQLGVKIGTVSGVSGGAITGAYYAVGGAPAGLFSGLHGHRFDLTRRLLEFPNVVRMAVKLEVPFLRLRLNPFSQFSRNDVQRELLEDVLYHGSTWNDLKNHMHLIVNSTDLTYGALLSFTDFGILHRHVNSPLLSSEYRNIPPQDEATLTSVTPRRECKSGSKLADAVMASGAFPGAFRVVDPHCFDPIWSGDAPFELADGGLNDNSGVGALIAAGLRYEELRSDVIIVSNAGAMLPDTTDDDLVGLFPNTSIEQGVRSIDVMFATTGSRRFAWSAYNPEEILLSPEAFDERSPTDTLYGKASASDDDRFYFSALRSLERTGARFGGEALSIPIKEITDSEMPEVNNALISKARGGSTPDPSALMQSALRCCHQGTGLYRGVILDNVLLFLAQDFAECAKTFTQVSTLDANLTAEQASRLYRLGEYLVIMNWGATKELLDEYELSHDSGPSLILKMRQEGENDDFGGHGTLRFEITNSSDATVKDVDLHSYLPKTFAITKITTDTRSTSLCSKSAQLISCLFGDMSPGSTREVSVNVEALRYLEANELGVGSGSGDVVIVKGVASSSNPSRGASARSGETQFFISLDR